MSISVAQMGARMHYAIPRILNEARILEQLFTDICGVKGWPQLLKRVPSELRPATLERLLTRIPKDVPPPKITAFTGFGFEYAKRLARARSNEERDQAFLWAGPEFGRLISRKGLGEASAVYGFNTASRDLFEYASKRGVKRILEQTITPRLIEQGLMIEEAAAFPEWERLEKSNFAKQLGEREQEEWDAADLVLCASDYVKDGIIECGGAAEKCTVVPYGIEQPPQAVGRGPRKPGILRVLTVGAVGLRKGSPYVMKAAEMLQGLAEFRMTGPHHCTEKAISELRKQVELPGMVPRSEISAHYAWADIYLLPSLCEGSATSTYEAMFHGLPVICTAHTGSIVRDGVDGFIIPERSPEAIAEKLEILANSSNMLESMSETALGRARQFTLDQYSCRLLAALASVDLR